MEVTDLIVRLLIGMSYSLPTSAASFKPSGPERPLGFPKDFRIGVGGSSFQVEGAWDENGKGVSVWDQFLHDRPYLINGDVTCDQYHKFEEDVALLSHLKFGHFRFSFSWTRLLPNGTVDFVNPDGVRYYNQLIDTLLAHNITPLVTINHFDIPQVFLETGGGWLDPKMPLYFRDYAEFCFKTFGDRVKQWVTINEPFAVCAIGYGNYGGGQDFPPAFNLSGLADYRCGHNVIMAHAMAYRVYERQFKDHQGGSIGITLVGIGAFPKDPDNAADLDAANRFMEFTLGWTTDPLVFGHYPASMREAAGHRLPEFTREERLVITGAFDFLTVDSYSGTIVSPNLNSTLNSDFSFAQDLNVTQSDDPSWPSASFNKFAPGALRGCVTWLHYRYSAFVDNLDLIVSETGWADFQNESLHDLKRWSFIASQVREVISAIEEGNIRVLGLYVWSLLDSLEFTNNYTQRFGLVNVDFTNPGLPRTPKASAYLVSNMVMEREVPYVSWPGP